MPHPILLYDGVCGLCDRFVQFILRRDPEGVFRFAALQSPLAARILARHGINAQDLDAVYAVVDYELAGERVLARSDAVIFVLKQLPVHAPFWRTAAFLLQCLPRSLRDWGYRVVARTRYRLFGRYDTCPIPTQETRARFLDM